jgi:four helix bundle protein
MEQKRKYDLEDRLVDFAVLVLNTVEHFPNFFAAKHLGSQLTRSGTSPALNYGEAQAAESRVDFIHKTKICLKELRESQVCLKIIMRKNWGNEELNQIALKECGELVAIFTTSIETAKQNLNKKS